MDFYFKDKISENINKLKNSDKLIIVEGKKDARALKELEVKKVITINKPLYKLIDSINEEEVIILTDLDKTGKKLYSVLKHNLQKRGVKIDNRFRNFLIRETKLSNIEGITSYINKL